MTPIDQEKQAALVEATAFLRRFTRREQDALNARVGVLVPSRRANATTLSVPSTCWTHSASRLAAFTRCQESGDR